MRQVESGSWVSDEQTVRHVRREVPWCLEDGSRARLPVLKGAKADEVYMETVGARARRPPRSCESRAAAGGCAACVVKVAGAPLRRGCAAQHGAGWPLVIHAGRSVSGT